MSPQQNEELRLTLSLMVVPGSTPLDRLIRVLFVLGHEVECLFEANSHDTRPSNLLEVVTFKNRTAKEPWLVGTKPTYCLMDMFPHTRVTVGLPERLDLMHSLWGNSPGEVRFRAGNCGRFNIWMPDFAHMCAEKKLEEAENEHGNG
jgi:hypothetical protein